MNDITPYSDFRLGDGIALERWLMVHDMRHTEYVRRFKSAGGSLQGPVNGDWMLRHSLQHQALAKAMRDPHAATELLALPGKWRTQQQLSDWHLLHNLLHTRIEGVIHGG